MDAADRRSAPGAPPLRALQRVANPAEAGWLVDFAQTAEARRLAQLEADNDLLNRLMWADYQGPEWELLHDRLIGYGYQVVFSWLRNGRIFAHCHARGSILLATRKSRELDEARSLAGETTALAVVKFRDKVLVPRVWRPDGNASLDSFFVGQCLIRFPNIYRRWLREHGWGGADALGDVVNRRGPTLDAVAESREDRGWGDPEARIAIEPYLDLAGHNAKTRRVLELTAAGYRQDEIAAETGLSVPSIKSRLYRLRLALTEGTHDAA